jgi:hypothetical protein
MSVRPDTIAADEVAQAEKKFRSTVEAALPLLVFIGYG